MFDTQLARWKLGKQNTPHHGGRLGPQQSANMMRDKSMLFKLEDIIIFTIY